MAKRWSMIAIFAWFGLHLMLAVTLPPADDELYYWCWAKELQPSYYDHPPMCAYLIRLATIGFGDTLFAVRLPACLCTLGSLLILARLIRPNHLIAVMLLMPLYSFGAILMTPDAPLLLFWTAYLAWLIRVHQRESAQWVIGGVLLGLGILSKYTMGLAFISAAVSLLLTRPIKQWIAGYVLHLLIAFVVTMPILVFNIQQNFAPLLYQWQHTMQSASPTVRHFPTFVGAQIILMGCLPFVLLPWAIVHRRSLLNDPRLRVCATLFVVPLVFFLYKASRSSLEANWALVSFIGFWPLTTHALSQWSSQQRKWAYSTFALPITVTLLLALHLSIPSGLLPDTMDRFARLQKKFAAMHEISEVIHAMPHAPTVFATSYQTTAQLRFQGIAAEQIAAVSRASHFTQRPHPLNAHDEVLVLLEGPLPDELLREFDPPELLLEFPVFVGDHLFIRYYLFRLTKSSHDGVAQLDRTTHR